MFRKKHIKKSFQMNGDNHTQSEHAPCLHFLGKLRILGVKHFLETLLLCLIKNSTSYQNSNRN